MLPTRTVRQASTGQTFEMTHATEASTCEVCGRSTRWLHPEGFALCPVCWNLPTIGLVIIRR